MPAFRVDFRHCFFGVTFLLVACAFVSGGCGRSRYPSATVTGRITIDGAPVPKGYITFSPVTGTKGPAVGAAIANGEYRCDKVPQGSVHVTFIAQAAKPMILFDRVNNVNREVPEDILPPACQEGQAAEIAAGVNQLDFDLKNE